MKKKELNMIDVYNDFNKLIKDEKIKFKFYNISSKLEVLQICQNKSNNVIEVSFCNIQEEYISELKELLNKFDFSSK